MKINVDVLLKHAVEATRKARRVAETRKGWEFMGYVGAALITDQGNIFTGINIVGSGNSEQGIPETLTS